MDIAAVLQRELEETRALLKEANKRAEEANNRLTKAETRHERQLREANDRLTEADARHERQLKEVNDRLDVANDRFFKFSNFALKTVTDAFTSSSPVLNRTREALKESTTVAYGCRARLVMRQNTATIDFVKGSPRRIRRQVEDDIEPRVLRSVNAIVNISETKTVASSEAADALAKGVIKHTKAAWEENGQQFTKKGVRVSFRQIALFVSVDEESEWFQAAVAFLSKTIANAIRAGEQYTSIVGNLSSGLETIEITLKQNVEEIEANALF
ncbi:hypothetical protein PHYBOEH_006493 [Phytophthora boehmeriae]|uniref:Uncharacterized protein n=1 Tax=Phytophthora boehmeriae TaxID=109152 RepID=A0A8T1WD78_9STRA|nr:hypothetical protein PHYBOEH_006493 [Phytophthora boehmeriae]